MMRKKAERHLSDGFAAYILQRKRHAKRSAAGELFVMKADGRAVAAARITKNQVAEYVNANWHKKNTPADKIMVLHTLVVDPLCKGKGYGTALSTSMKSSRSGADARLGYTEADIVPCDFNRIRGISLVCLEKNAVRRITSVTARF